jgi:HEAT repeat protein
MQTDPEQAFPVIEKMLSGANSPRVKDRALFVVSQSRSPRARDLIVSVAKGSGNPDLQLRAIRYIGLMGGGDNRQILADIYAASTDTAVKRNILRSFMTANDRERLFALAKNEADATLRGEAVRQLGVLGALSELSELYRTETSTDVKRSILQSMHVAGDGARLSELAKGEKDPELRRTAIRNLGLMNTPGTTETLIAIYGSDPSADVRRAVINALFLQGNAAALITLARGEQNPGLKRDIVSKLSNMKSKAATDYLVELLK